MISVSGLTCAAVVWSAPSECEFGHALIDPFLHEVHPRLQGDLLAVPISRPDASSCVIVMSSRKLLFTSYARI